PSIAGNPDEASTAGARRPALARLPCALCRLRSVILPTGEVHGILDVPAAVVRGGLGIDAQRPRTAREIGPGRGHLLRRDPLLDPVDHRREGVEPVQPRAAIAV